MQIRQRRRIMTKVLKKWDHVFEWKGSVAICLEGKQSIWIELPHTSQHNYILWLSASIVYLRQTDNICVIEIGRSDHCQRCRASLYKFRSAVFSISTIQWINTDASYEDSICLPLWCRSAFGLVCVHAVANVRHVAHVNSFVIATAPIVQYYFSVAAFVMW